MGNIKRQHSAAFKAKVAMELINGNETMAAVCSKYSIHPTQARRWKDRALETLQLSFTGKNNSELKAKDELIEELYKQIGQLKVELDWLKKKMHTFK